MVCSVCGVKLEGGGTMRTDYLHPNGIVAACVYGDWRPITEQQLADELAALRECVRSGDKFFPLADDRAELVDPPYRQARKVYLSTRAKVVLP